MPIATDGPVGDGELFTQVDDEQYEELSALIGQPIVYVAVWDEGMADALDITLDNTLNDTLNDTLDEAAANDESAADLDLYLQDGVYFELYGTLCYHDLDAPPLATRATIEQALSNLATRGVKLLEVAVDEEDGLVLVLGRGDQPDIYLQVGAWLLDEWEELPDHSES